MANDVFDIKQNLKIEYFNSSISAWVDIVADSFEVDIDRGIEVENGVFAQPSIGTATVKLVKKSLSDFLGTPGYKAGDRFNIAYQNEPDTNPSNYVDIFGGYIQNVSMNYLNASQVLEITIVVNDIMRWALNANLPTLTITGTTTQRSFRNAMTTLFTAISSQASAIGGVVLSAIAAGASSTVQRAFTWLNTAGGEIMSQFMNAELAWAWADRSDANTVLYLARTDVAALRAETYNPANLTVSNVHYTNLLTNGTFEVNTTGWSLLTSGAFTRVTTQFYMGIASAQLSSSLTTLADYGVRTSTTMTSQVGSKYKGSVWVKGNSNTSSAAVNMVFYNSGGSVVQNTTSGWSAINTTGWTQVSWTAVAPINSVRVEIRVYGKKVSAAIASMFIDNAKIENLTTISNNHVCLDNISLNYDSDLLVNKAKVTEVGGGTSATVSNTTSITANGQHANSYTVNYDAAGSPTTLTNLATRIANSATIKQVQGITVPVIRDDGRVSSIAAEEIGNTLQVEFAQDPLAPLQEISIISRINHVITPQHWEMNIGLWRAI